MIRNIIWDVDGTLFDTYPAFAASFRAALNDFGKEAEAEWIAGLARQSMETCLSTLAARYQLNAEDLYRRFAEHYERVKSADQPPFPGVIAVCRHIRENGGKNVIVTHRGRAGTRQLLAAHNMNRFFSGYLTADDGYPRKPDPSAFEAALLLYDLDRSETMAVGDRDLDIQAGRAAGLTSCRFGSVTEGVAADLTVEHFDELYRYLAGTQAVKVASRRKDGFR